MCFADYGWFKQLRKARPAELCASGRTPAANVGSQCISLQWVVRTRVVHIMRHERAISPLSVDEKWVSSFSRLSFNSRLRVAIFDRRSALLHVRSGKIRNHVSYLSATWHDSPTLVIQLL